MHVMYVIAAGVAILLLSLAAGGRLEEAAKRNWRPVSGDWSRRALKGTIALYVVALMASVIAGRSRSAEERAEYIFFGLLLAALAMAYRRLAKGSQKAVEGRPEGSVPQERLRVRTNRQSGAAAGAALTSAGLFVASLADGGALMDGSITMIAVGTALYSGLG
jgi:hypothetical protein